MANSQVFTKAGCTGSHFLFFLFNSLKTCFILFFIFVLFILLLVTIVHYNTEQQRFKDKKVLFSMAL